VTVSWGILSGVDDSRFRPELDGGSLMDVGCYRVNAIRFLAASRSASSQIRSSVPSGVDICFAAVAPANSYRLELENVCDSIRGITPLLLGREDAVGQARTIDALPRSADGSVAVSTARGVHKHDLPAISAGPRRVVAVRHALPKTRPGPRAARSDGQPLSFSA
jgi:predicted dehydrogenase